MGSKFPGFKRHSIVETVQSGRKTKKNKLRHKLWIFALNSAANKIKTTRNLHRNLQPHVSSRVCHLSIEKLPHQGFQSTLRNSHISRIHFNLQLSGVIRTGQCFAGVRRKEKSLMISELWPFLANVYTLTIIASPTLWWCSSFSFASFWDMNTRSNRRFLAATRYTSKTQKLKGSKLFSCQLVCFYDSANPKQCSLMSLMSKKYKQLLLLILLYYIFNIKTLIHKK